ncbi:MAG: hypothetical protein CEE38_17440 [Planctomycetes bacterium B3_Pla]|nr:MAG: hypothetical protein CEE38_17440 [Planctomycetes bacterium B3_Pla]
MVFNWFRKTTLCPSCDSQWDGNRCFRCGYIKKLSGRQSRLLEQIKAFFDPVTHSPEEIYNRNQLIPQAPGVYAWYFDNHFGTYFTVNTPSPQKIVLDSAANRDWYLLYIGIAGKKRGRTLRDRIGDHLNQNSEGSTLRQSLAALLGPEIKLNSAMQLNGENEKQKLNRWIFQHARVSWVRTSKAERIEELMIRNFGGNLRFNIKGNKSNTCRKELQRLRKSWRKAGK